MEQAVPESLRGQTVADVMLATPKTLPADTTVAHARAALADDRVQMLLLTDGSVFRGAVTGIPEDADEAAAALAYADQAVETMSPSESAEAGYERTSQSPHRRVVVLGADDSLVGLLCLNPTRTHFCSGGRSQE